MPMTTRKTPEWTVQSIDRIWRYLLHNFVHFGNNIEDLMFPGKEGDKNSTQEVKKVEKEENILDAQQPGSQTRLSCNGDLSRHLDAVRDERRLDIFDGPRK